MNNLIYNFTEEEIKSILGVVKIRGVFYTSDWERHEELQIYTDMGNFTLSEFVKAINENPYFGDFGLNIKRAIYERELNLVMNEVAE